MSSDNRTLIRSVVLLMALVLLSGVFVFSASHEFLFFVDSRTYLSGRVWVPFLTQTLFAHPVSTALVALFNIVVIVRMLRLRMSFLTLCLLTPYNLLLVTNLTKESFIFLGLAMFYGFRTSLDWRLRTMSYAFLSLLAIRPVYFLMYLVRLRYAVFSVVFAVVVYVLFQDELNRFIQEAMFRLQDRDLVPPSGRPFFSDLCVVEKVDPWALVGCLTPNLFLLPQHEDLFTLNYLVFLTFQIPTNAVILGLLFSKSGQHRIIALTIIALYYLLFVMSPSFGAFIRYFHPVIWIGAANILFEGHQKGNVRT